MRRKRSPSSTSAEPPKLPRGAVKNAPVAAADGRRAAARRPRPRNYDMPPGRDSGWAGSDASSDESLPAARAAAPGSATQEPSSPTEVPVSTETPATPAAALGSAAQEPSSPTEVPVSTETPSTPAAFLGLATREPSSPTKVPTSPTEVPTSRSPTRSPTLGPALSDPLIRDPFGVAPNNFWQFGHACDKWRQDPKGLNRPERPPPFDALIRGLTIKDLDGSTTPWSSEEPAPYCTWFHVLCFLEAWDAVLQTFDGLSRTQRERLCRTRCGHAEGHGLPVGYTPLGICSVTRHSATRQYWDAASEEGVFYHKRFENGARAGHYEDRRPDERHWQQYCKVLGALAEYSDALQPVGPTRLPVLAHAIAQHAAGVEVLIRTAGPKFAEGCMGRPLTVEGTNPPTQQNPPARHAATRPPVQRETARVRARCLSFFSSARPQTPSTAPRSRSRARPW